MAYGLKASSCHPLNQDVVSTNNAIFTMQHNINNRCEKNKWNMIHYIFKFNISKYG